MDDLNFEDDVIDVNTNALADVGLLASQVLSLDEQIEFATQSLKNLTDSRRKLLEEDIPAAMDAANVSEFKTTDGHKLTVSDYVNASITKANEEEAFKWLDENGHGSLIKTDVTAKFGRNDLEEAKRALSLLEGNGMTATMKQSVHASTLKAFAKEQYENGKTLPESCFSVHQGRVAKIK